MAEKTVREELENQSNGELMADARALYESIYVTGCFGRKDTLLLELAYRELERRGYDIREVKRLGITRKK